MFTVGHFSDHFWMDFGWQSLVNFEKQLFIILFTSGIRIDRQFVVFFKHGIKTPISVKERIDMSNNVTSKIKTSIISFYYTKECMQCDSGSLYILIAFKIFEGHFNKNIDIRFNCKKVLQFRSYHAMFKPQTYYIKYTGNIQ